MSFKRSVLFGAFLGVLLFLGESALVLRNEAAGLSIDVKGPFAALIDIAKAAIPLLLAKVVLLYVAFGAAGGALAHVAAHAASLGRWGYGVFLALLAIFPMWWRAIRTPALFDDLPLARPMLTWLVDHGEPWHPLAVVAIVLALWFARVVQTTGKRALLWAATAIVLAGAVTVWRSIERVPAHAYPVVILFGIDALRPDRLHAFGNERAVVPNADAFAADATLFSAAYTPIAQTEPAWRSLLTGLYPSEHGLRFSLIRAQDRKPADTFAARFSAAGWQTVFRTDCSRFNFQDETSGFGERVQPPRGALNFLLEKIRYRGLVTYAGARLSGWIVPELAHNRALAGFYDAEDYARIVADDVVARASKGPLLYAYHATAAHFPGDAMYPFYRRFTNESAPIERRLRMHFRPVERGTQDPHTEPDTDQAMYDALVAQADMQLGVLLERLKRAGIYDRATIVVFSDHGEDFYEGSPSLKGAMSVHGALLNERQNRIVLAVKPGTRKRGPAEVRELVRLIDVAPTLLELASVPSDAKMSGRSFAQIFDGRTTAGLPQQRLLAETTFTHVNPDVFVPDHYVGARRDFEAYRLHQSGLVEIEDQTHDAILREKDFGAFDGRSWFVTYRKKDGQLATRCQGECEKSGLRAWFADEARAKSLVWQAQ